MAPVADSKSGQLQRIVETALYVDDMRRSRAFYVDALGCDVLLDSARLLALSVGGASVLLLFQRGATSTPLETPGGVVPPHGASGIQHLAFAIPADALDTWLRRLEENDISIESRVRWPRGGESLYVRDPDGHSIELITPGLWAIY
jgi:catechol 2,3-dioxygenase-like lactoylglutathione lyase family enzyme